MQEAGLQNVAHVFFAPLEEGQVEGVHRLCYSLGEEAHRGLDENATLIEWVLVDGPAGDGLVRFGTLPLVRSFIAPTARWFLDDAHRDEERAVLEEWARLPYLNVEGTFGVGKGLASGRFIAS